MSLVIRKIEQEKQNLLSKAKTELADHENIISECNNDILMWKSK